MSESTEQKFHKGDHVMIADDLGPCMKHFIKGAEAIVMYSYADKYGGDDIESFCLFIKDEGEHSWYYGSQLTLIASGQHELLKEWQKKLDADIEQKSDIDWIFENGPDVVKYGYGSSLARLGNDLGIDNMWGSRGEGITLMHNQAMVMAAAHKFLNAKDKPGWDAFVAGLPET